MSIAPSKKSVASVCPYCGVGCGILLEVENNKVIKVSGNKNHPSNFGRLCTKGSTSAQALTNSGRMEAAFVRHDRRADPVQTPMDEAITVAASRLNDIRNKHGADALAFYVSGQMSTEAQYLANKLAKGYIGTNNIESNSRLCMASAGAGYKLSLGSDAPPGSYQDFEKTDLFFVIGANMADCHPILYLRMMDRVKAGAKLIVVDPRRTTTADKADLFLHIKPGTDLALLNGLLNLMVVNGHIDPDFIAQFTDDWAQMPAFLADYTPAAVAQITGLAESDIIAAGQLMAAAPEMVTCWTMGLNQSTHGTWNTNAICNLHLATGKICRPGSGPFSLTGQPNAMGGREMGYMGPGLPGQRSLLVDEERRFTEQVWGLPAGSIQTRLGKGTIDMFERMAAGEIKACWIICTNPVASVPNRKTVIAGLQTAELVIAQDAFLETETNLYADILLPGALWAEAEGVMINSERNITLMQQAVSPPGQALADWQIVAKVAVAMGFTEGFNFQSAAEVFAEIQQFSNPKTGYDLSGVSYQRLLETPLQWPCPADKSDSRNPIRYLNNGVSQTLKISADNTIPALAFATDTGRAKFLARPHLPPAEMPDDEFPLMLNTGRLQHQWHTMTKTGKIPTLNKLNPGTFVEINPEDAKSMGIENGSSVEIRSRRGTAVLPAVVTDRVVSGSCFAPIHWNDVYGENLCINAVTSDHVDPISQQPELKICAVAVRKIDTIKLVTLEEDEDQGETPVLARGALSLVRTFAEFTGVATATAPDFSAIEQQYLSGFIKGLQASVDSLAAVPVIPASAPFSVDKRTWVDGLLAGLFSRVAAVEPALAKPAITLLWASQTGNAEALAEATAARLSSAGWQVQRYAMDDYPAVSLAGEKYLVLITSTFGDGDAPDNAQGFWSLLDSVAAPQLDHVHFAVLALGDSNYDQFCGFGKKLDARLLALDARHLLARVDCDADYEETAASWQQNLLAVLPAAAQERVDEGKPNRVLAPSVNAPVGFSKTNPYASQLVLNRRLNADSGTKDTRLLGFALADSGLSYEAGDALGVWPQNCPELVEEILQSTGLHADAAVDLGKSGLLPLGRALLSELEIAKPHPDFIPWLAERNGSDKLRNLVLEENKSQLKSWLYGRQLADLLQEFPVSVSAQELVQLLKRLQPRLYSIASSPKIFSDQVHLCVSAVRYAQGSRNRKGVCSTFLADRASAVVSPIFVQPTKHFKLPSDGDLPVIMIGPGTGVAPFRGFLQERAARGDAGPNWLFFGEQHAASDFYFKEELQRHVEQGVLQRLSLAFSRDQAAKIYVQDRIRQEGAEVWRWLNEGAHLYICGDATRMAKDVDQALAEVIAREGGMSLEDGAEQLRKLAEQKRYLRDVY